MSTQSELSSVQWDWADTKVHPAIQYPSSWINDPDTDDNDPAIAMVDSFNPRIVTPKDPIHSLNDYNQGFVTKPPEYYVDITCKPFGAGYELLLACQNGDRYFDVILVPMEDNESAVVVGTPKHAWAPQYEVYKACKVTNLSERYAMGTAPTVTFTCRALRFVLDEGNAQVEFGNGKKGRTYATIPGLQRSGTL